MDFEIANDYDAEQKRYWYIITPAGMPLYDEDGNNIHFSSYDLAAEFLKQLQEG